MAEKITVKTTVNAPITRVWEAYVTPADIEQWNAASEAWRTTNARVDLREGGEFSSRMEAKDGSMGFDFAGKARVDFDRQGDGVRVRVTFDAEDEHPVELQRDGWQAILDNFARHVEAG